MRDMLTMKELTIEQKKKINDIKEKMFKELKEYDKQQKETENVLDGGQGNPIISKYKKQIEKVINGTQMKI